MSALPPRSGRLISLKDALSADADPSQTMVQSQPSDPLLPKPLTRPYRFEDVGWKPLVNYIPEPVTPPGLGREAELNWLD